MSARQFFRFPNPVNETSARLVAAGVVAETALFFAVRQWWVLVPLVFGFLARVATGPRLSPLGRFVTEILTPRLHVEHRFVPGPPKRFAQAVGATFSTAGFVCWLAGEHLAAFVLIGFITVAASLESGLAICLGCIVFNRLMRWGVIPASVCEGCNDLSRRLAKHAATGSQPTEIRPSAA